MNEINNNGNDFKISKSVPVNPKIEKAEGNSVQDINTKDYKEAVQAPGAEALGRAQMNIDLSKVNQVDNIENDIAKIISNPALLDRSNALFNAAEMAGISYPEAATFATTEG